MLPIPKSRNRLSVSFSRLFQVMRELVIAKIPVLKRFNGETYQNTSGKGDVYTEKNSPIYGEILVFCPQKPQFSRPKNKRRAGGKAISRGKMHAYSLSMQG